MYPANIDEIFFFFFFFFLFLLEYYCYCQCHQDQLQCTHFISIVNIHISITIMAPRTSAFDLSKCARPNILELEPYRCAREYVTLKVKQNFLGEF